MRTSCQHYMVWSTVELLVKAQDAQVWHDQASPWGCHFLSFSFESVLGTGMFFPGKQYVFMSVYVCLCGGFVHSLSLAFLDLPKILQGRAASGQLKDVQWFSMVISNPQNTDDSISSMWICELNVRTGWFSWSAMVRLTFWHLQWLFRVHFEAKLMLLLGSFLHFWTWIRRKDTQSRLSDRQDIQMRTPCYTCYMYIIGMDSIRHTVSYSLSSVYLWQSLAVNRFHPAPVPLWQYHSLWWSYRDSGRPEPAGLPGPLSCQSALQTTGGFVPLCAFILGSFDMFGSLIADSLFLIGDEQWSTPSQRHTTASNRWCDPGPIALFFSGSW